MVALLGAFFVETVKMFRDEDDRIIMECSRKDFEKIPTGGPPQPLSPGT